MNPISFKFLKAVGICAAIAALTIGAMPVSPAYMQGQSPLPTPRPTATATRPPKRVPAPKLITKRIQETNAKAFYEIDVKYPAINSTAPAWVVFNALAESQAKEAIAAFKKDVASAGVFTATGVPTHSLTVGWESYRVTNDFVSVRSTIGVYMAGAAHPNYGSRTINFDPRTSKALALGDLFKQVNTDYLGALSVYCKRVLTRQGRFDFPEGADPKPANYANWNMGRFNLLISFDPYQVTPYAAGRVECEVPLRSLRTLLAEPRRW